VATEEGGGGIFTCSMFNPLLQKDQIKQTSRIAMEMWGSIILLENVVIGIIGQLWKQPVFQHVLVLPVTVASVKKNGLCIFR
jgi:hypothetical protein